MVIEVKRFEDFYQKSLGQAFCAASYDVLVSLLAQKPVGVVLGYGLCYHSCEIFDRCYYVLSSSFRLNGGIKQKKVCVSHLSALPFGEGCFSSVVMVHALEYERDLISIMSEAWRVLQEEGVLIFMVPAAGNVWRGALRVFEDSSCFSKRALKKLVEQSGFYDVSFHRLCLFNVLQKNKKLFFCSGVLGLMGGFYVFKLVKRVPAPIIQPLDSLLWRRSKLLPV